MKLFPPTFGKTGGQYPAFGIGAMLLFVLGGLAALLGNDLVRSHEREFTIAQREAYNLTGTIERHVKASTDKIDVVLREAVHAYTPVMTGTAKADVLSANRDLLRREAFIPEAQVKSLRIMDAEGRVVFSAGESADLPKVNVADRAYFLKQKTDPEAGLVLSEPILSRFTGQWLFTLSRRMNFPDGRFAGLIQTAMRADYFQTGFKTIDVGAHGSIALFTSDFRLVARHPPLPDQLGKSFDLKQVGEGLGLARQTGSYKTLSRIDETQRVFNYRKLDGLPLVINIGMAPDDFLKGWKEKAWIYGISLLALSLELIALIYFQRKINRENLVILEQKVTERTLELGQTNEKLHQAMLAAESASHAKSQFLANMAHEIRTPMNGVLGMTELMLHGELSEEQRGYAGIVMSSGQGLLTVLNDILDYSKIEAGKLSVETLAFNPREAVEQVAALFQKLAVGKGLAFALSFSEDFPDSVVSDPTRVRQILSNLISNAIKFTHQGSVLVRAESLVQDERRFLRFLVADSGIGMDNATRAGLFQAFSQGDGSVTRKFGGTGLGLVIARNLCELLGGTIAVDSEPGKGSTFRFEIPA